MADRQHFADRRPSATTDLRQHRCAGEGQGRGGMQSRPLSHQFERNSTRGIGKDNPDRQPFADRRGLQICASAQSFEAIWLNDEIKTAIIDLMDILLKQWGRHDDAA